jgi:hypothetical protein
MQLLNSLPFSLVPKIPAAQRMRKPIKNIMTLFPPSGKQNLTQSPVILFHQPLKGKSSLRCSIRTPQTPPLSFRSDYHPG